MTTVVLTRAALLALPLLAACARPANRSGAPTTDAALRAAATRWARAWDAGDLEGITNGFAEGAVSYYPGSPPTVGRAAHRARWARFYARRNAAHPMTVDTLIVAASGDIGVTRGRYAVRYDADTGRVNLGGRYVAGWRRGPDGAWQVATAASNAYTPPPGLEARP